MTDVDIRFDDSGEIARYRLNGKPVLSAEDEGLLDWLAVGLEPKKPGGVRSPGSGFRTCR